MNRIHKVVLGMYLVSIIVLFISVEHFRHVFVQLDEAEYVNGFKGYGIFSIVIWTNAVVYYILTFKFKQSILFKMVVFGYYGLYISSLAFHALTNSAMLMESLDKSWWENLHLGFSRISYEFYLAFIVLSVWALIKIVIEIKRTKQNSLYVVLIPFILNISLLLLLLTSNEDLSYSYIVSKLYVPITAIVNIVTAFVVLFKPNIIET